MLKIRTLYVKFLALLLCALASDSASFAQVQLDTSGVPTQMTVYLRTVDGDVIAEGELELTSRSDKKAAAIRRHVRDGDVLSIPSDSYSVSFRAPVKLLYFREAEFIAEPKRGLLLVAAQFETTDLPRPHASVLIHVDPSKSCSGTHLFVRLFGMYTSVLTEQALSTAGDVLFADLDHGLYHAVPIDGKQVRGAKDIRTFGPQLTVAIGMQPCQ